MTFNIVILISFVCIGAALLGAVTFFYYKLTKDVKKIRKSQFDMINELVRELASQRRMIHGKMDKEEKSEAESSRSMGEEKQSLTQKWSRDRGSEGSTRK